MGPTKNPPRYAITGSITLPLRTAYIILREEDDGHWYGVAVYDAAPQHLITTARALSQYVRTWHRSVQGAMDEANTMRV